MLDVNPQIFSISRPPLDGYKAFVQRDMIVETYRSAAGQMASSGSLHRISINRTAHRRYAYRLGAGALQRVERRPFTLGFQPANVPLEVDGDDASYISIFQAPELYERIGGASFRPADWSGEALSTVTDPTTLQIALSLALTLDNPAGADPLLMEHLGIALACSVIKLLGAPPVRQDCPLAPPHLRRVFDHIERSLGRSDLSVDELAGIAHLSPYHFSRAFKLATGMAPHRFVLERRIARARLHLGAGRESIAEIAYAMGFSSQAHFSSMFQRFTGMTPRQYRQSVRL